MGTLTLVRRAGRSGLGARVRAWGGWDYVGAAFSRQRRRELLAAEVHAWIARSRDDLAAIERTGLLTPDAVRDVRRVLRRDIVNVTAYAFYAGPWTMAIVFWPVYVAVAVAFEIALQVLRVHNGLPFDKTEGSVAAATGVALYVTVARLPRWIPGWYLRLHILWAPLATLAGYLGFALCLAADADRAHRTLMITALSLLLAAAFGTADIVLFSVRQKQYVRLLVRRGRVVPTHHRIAVGLVGVLAVLVTLRSQQHRIRLSRELLMLEATAAWFERNIANFSSPRHTGADRRHKQTASRLGRHAAAAVRGHSTDLVCAETQAAYDKILFSIRDQLVNAVKGDTELLMQQTEPHRRTAAGLIFSRVAPAVTLAAAALVLPRLPGVAATTPSLAGIQIGLLVAAVLMLLGTSSEDRRIVGSAWTTLSHRG